MNTPIFLYRLRNKIKIQKNNYMQLGEKVGLSGCNIIIKGENNQLFIEDNARLRKVTIEIVGSNCKITIGKNSVIGHGCYISAKEESIYLQIGNNCMLSRNVNILTSDGHPVFKNAIRINPAQSIYINNHVWLADDVTILKGVTIGEGSIIGIHSLVTKSIPEHSIAVGVPAKIIKSEIVWEL